MRRRAAYSHWPPSSGRAAPRAPQLAAWLCEALRGEDDTMVETLLRKGADPNLVLPEGMAPIHLAAGLEQESGLRCLRLLLRHGGDPNARSMEDLTPLHVAASWGCATCLRLLLADGGDPRLQDQDGSTALDLALEQGNAACARILRQALEGDTDAQQSSWSSHRRAESFLSTVMDDTMEAGGILRHCGADPLSRTSVSSQHGNIGCGVFPSLIDPGGRPHGCPPSKRMDETSSGRDRSSASFLTECSWDEIPTPSESHVGSVILKPRCEPDRLQDATLDLAPYGSFLDAELAVKPGARQGLDVTSPDHAFLFSRGDATMAEDLERTLAAVAERSCNQYVTCNSEASAAGEPEAILGCSPISQRVKISPEASLDSPDKWQTLGHSWEAQTSGLCCCAGKNGSPTDAPRMRRERRDLGKHPRHSEDLVIPTTENQVVPERCFRVENGSGTTAVSEEGETQDIQDTVLIQRTPGMSTDVAETVPVSHPSPAEDALSDLEAQLRSMLLATKASHSPLLRPFDVAERPLSTPTAKTTASSSLFDEDLAMPRRPRRVRSPEGRPPVARRGCVSTAGPQHESPFRAEGGEAGSLADTQLIPVAIREPGSPKDIRQERSDETDGKPSRSVSPKDIRKERSNEMDGKPSRSVSPKDIRKERSDETDGKQFRFVSPKDIQKERGNNSNKTDAKPSSEAKNTRVSFSRMPLRGPSLAATCVPVVRASRLSPGGRPVDSAAAEPVEYLYVDEDEGHSLVERRVPFTDESLSGSEDTVVYDWRDYAGKATGGTLADTDLVRELRDFGVSPGPVTGLTRKLYAQLLERLRRDPRTKARKDAAGYSPELAFALETFQIPDAKEDEMALIGQFDRPDQSRKWREGLLKSSFNYLLLDPRVTQNLPFCCHFVSQAECFRTFVSAVFYVGKGKRSRPYSHLYEALTHYNRGGRGKPPGKGSSKVRHILEIWESGQGVVSMHCFQNVVPVEAYTREACMVDAIGLKMLTNLKKGDYYGLVAGWPLKRRRRLGVHLLHRAMQIFLAEGERQLRPADIRPP